MYGQLCFYKPAPTIFTPAKSDHPLRPGISLDYYVDYNGKFTGQYVVCDLEDFAGKTLHHRIGPAHFKLSLHRTEVVREPIGSIVPLFPLRRKYRRANYSLEGIEDHAAGKPDETPAEDFGGKPPLLDEVAMEGESVYIGGVEGVDFKFSADGRRLQIGADGTWNRRRANWRPEEIPKEYWNAHPEIHEELRKQFPDPRREKPTLTDADASRTSDAAPAIPGDPSGASPARSTDDAGGIADGNLSTDLGLQAKVGKNYWEETPDTWIFWRVEPAKGFLTPRLGGNVGPQLGDLVGTRRTEATFEDATMVTYEDSYGMQLAETDNDRRSMRERIAKESWTGPVIFEKLISQQEVPVSGEPIAKPSKPAGSSAVAQHHPPGVVAKVKARLRGTPMSDSLVQPCLQESEEWPTLYADIERQRSSMEELSWFERAVTDRIRYADKHSKSVRGDSFHERADLAGLAAHDSPPTDYEPVRHPGR